jgi:hypothetical protein
VDSTPPAFGSPNDPLRTDTEILDRVGQLIVPESREWRSLVLFFLDRQARTLPVVVPVDDVPEDPEPAVIENLCWILSQVLDDQEPDGSVVMMLTRPGPPEPEPADMLWRERLGDAAAKQGVRVRLICLATPDGLTSLTAGPMAPP